MDYQLAREKYQERLPLLQQVATALEGEIRNVIEALPRVDRVSFRAKSPASFIDKAQRKHCVSPLLEIEDQIAGRIIVFFRGDIDAVCSKLQGMNPVEQWRHASREPSEFGYESTHLIQQIPPQVIPRDWSRFEDMPTTFELQVRTLFMHAFSEPQHDLVYKSSGEVPHEIRRKLAWIAASAWGSDEMYEQIWGWSKDSN